MHYTANFCDSQRARGLLNHFQSERQWHWPIAANTSLERFAFDQFHGIETLAVLLSIKGDSSDIRMMNIRSRARFAQKTRSRTGILRHAAINDF